MTIKAAVAHAEDGGAFRWRWISRKPGIYMLDALSPASVGMHIHEVYDHALAVKFSQRLEAAGGRMNWKSLEACRKLQRDFIYQRDGVWLDTVAYVPATGGLEVNE